MSKKISIIALILAIAAMALSVYSFSSRQNTPAAESEDIQYVMYLGLSNPIDRSQMTFEEGEKKLQPILTKHFPGFTIQTAKGGWLDDNGVYCQENTLVIYLSDTGIEEVRTAADDLIKEFQQSSILIQSNKTTTEFYTGQ